MHVPRQQREPDAHELDPSDAASGGELVDENILASWRRCAAENVFTPNGEIPVSSGDDDDEDETGPSSSGWASGDGPSEDLQDK